MLDDQKELFIVVDENDTVLSYKTRYECHHNPKLIHRAVNVVLFNSMGKVALQKRSMLKDTNPGKMTVSATGHVTKGQTYDEAAKREMKEELGIEVPLTFIAKYISKNPTETQMVSLYKGNYNGKFSPAKDEVDSINFYTKAEIQKLLSQITPIGKDALKHVDIL